MCTVIGAAIARRGTSSLPRSACSRCGWAFLTGESFTVPDLILGHCARWASAAIFDLPAGRRDAYFGRVLARPALARALAAAAIA